MSDAPEPADAQPASILDSQVLVKADRPLARLALALLVLIMVIYLLEKFAIILQQFLLAVFIVYLLMPIHRWLVKRFHVPSFLAYLIIAASVITVGTLLVIEVRERVAEMIENVPEYTESFTRVIQKMTGKKLEKQKLHLVITGQSGEGNNNVRQIREMLQQIIGLSTHAFVVLIYLLFLLAERASFSARLKAAFPQQQGEQIVQTFEQINNSINEYIYVKTFVSILTGLLSGLALWALGVEYALLWALLTFILNYVPYLGALVAMVPPVLLALIQFESLGYALLTLTMLTIIQNAIGYGIEPYMTGKRVDLSPLVLIASLAFWGALWGIVGMVLAVPFMVVIKAILQHIPTTQPLAVLLSMSPPEEPRPVELPVSARPFDNKSSEQGFTNVRPDKRKDDP